MFECYDKTCYLRTCPALAPTECYRAECPDRVPEDTGKKDYIDRSAAVDMFTAAEKEGPGADFPVIKRMLANLPAADVAPVRHGSWERNSPDDIVVYCSQCMMPQDAPSNYCPSCGARMDKETEE